MAGLRRIAAAYARHPSINLAAPWMAGSSPAMTRLLVGSNRQPDRRPQPTHCTFIQHDIPAMRPGDVAGDGQAQAGAAALQVAALIQAVKGTEGFLPPPIRNAGAIVLHRDLRQPLIAGQAHRYLVAMLESIVDQVGQAAAQGGALDADMDMRRHGDGNAAALLARPG